MTRELPERELPEGMRAQLDAPSFQGPATFGMRPFLTEPAQLDAWKPDVAIIGAPWDDNTTNRHILRLQLGSWRMRCREADSGAAALAAMRDSAAANDDFDLALLDMQMPEMDGLSLARAIKNDPALSATRLLILSSIGSHAFAEDFKKAGIEEYLVKPVRQSALYNSISSVMSRVPASKPVLSPEAALASTAQLLITLLAWPLRNHYRSQYNEQ